VKEYSKDIQLKLANEIESAPPNAAFPELMLDYATLREQLHGCTH